MYLFPYREHIYWKVHHFAFWTTVFYVSYKMIAFLPQRINKGHIRQTYSKHHTQWYSRGQSARPLLESGISPLGWTGCCWPGDAPCLWEWVPVAPARWAAGTRPTGMTVLALTVMEEGAAAGLLSKTKRQQQQDLIRPLPGQYPVHSNCTAAKRQL